MNLGGWNDGPLPLITLPICIPIHTDTHIYIHDDDHQIFNFADQKYLLYNRTIIYIQKDYDRIVKKIDK